MSEIPTTHEGFVLHVRQDPMFREFLDTVAPKEKDSGIQKVWLSELFLILKILWEIYNVLKGMGWFTKWWTTIKLKRAMAKKDEAEKQEALAVIRNGLMKQAGYKV